MVQTKEIPPEAILLAVYLELQNGKWAVGVGGEEQKYSHVGWSQRSQSRDTDPNLL